MDTLKNKRFTLVILAQWSPYYYDTKERNIMG